MDFLAELPHLSGQDTESCEVLITLEEVIEAMADFGADKALGLDGLLYELYKSMTDLFRHLLEDVYSNWQQNGLISKFVCRGVVTPVRKDPNKGYSQDNFRFITLLSTELKILAKVLAKKVEADGLVGRVKTCAILGRTIQDNLPLIRYTVGGFNESDKGGANGPFRPK